MEHSIFNKFLEQWHLVVEQQDSAVLSEILAEEVVFYSPVVHTPQRGKKITTLYLMGAGAVLREKFTYTNKIVNGLHGVLQFTCQIDDITIDGVDIIELNTQGQIINFKVMLRPLKAVHKVHEKMGQMLERFKKTS